MQNVTLTRNVVVGVVAFIGTPATLDIQALMLFVLNIEEKQREDALSLFRQQDCGIVHQLKLGN